MTPKTIIWILVGVYIGMALLLLSFDKVIDLSFVFEPTYARYQKIIRSLKAHVSCDKTQENLSIKNNTNRNGIINHSSDNNRISDNNQNLHPSPGYLDKDQSDNEAPDEDQDTQKPLELNLSYNTSDSSEENSHFDPNDPVIIKFKTKKDIMNCLYTLTIYHDPAFPEDFLNLLNKTKCVDFKKANFDAEPTLNRTSPSIALLIDQTDHQNPKVQSFLDKLAEKKGNSVHILLFKNDDNDFQPYEVKGLGIFSKVYYNIIEGAKIQKREPHVNSIIQKFFRSIRHTSKDLEDTVIEIDLKKVLEFKRSNSKVLVTLNDKTPLKSYLTAELTVGENVFIIFTAEPRELEIKDDDVISWRVGGNGRTFVEQSIEAKLKDVIKRADT